MRIEQLHYTSCRDGLSGSAGFQYAAASPGVDAQTMQEIQPFIGYRPPPTAPLQPSPEQIAAFPLALSYLPLPAGGSILCESRYAGLDYTGRYGNFFAHVLYLPDGTDPWDGTDGLAWVPLPIEVWRSLQWTRQPAASTELPPMSGLRPGTAVSPETAAAFARTPGRAERLAAFLADVRDAVSVPGSPQVVVVEQSADDVAQWVAVASYSLPRTLAGRLSFITYTHRPHYAPHAVIGIGPGADFGFSSAELTQYRVHDLITGLGSEPADDPWAVLAARLWQEDRAHLFAAGQALATRCAGGRGDADPFAVLAAVAFADGVTLSGPALERALSWATQSAAAPVPELWGDFDLALARVEKFVDLAVLSELYRAWSGRRPVQVDSALVAGYTARLVQRLGRAEAVPDSPWLPTALPAATAEQMQALVDRCCSAYKTVYEPDLSWVLSVLTLADRMGVSCDPELAHPFGYHQMGPALLAGKPVPAGLFALLDGPSWTDAQRGMLERLNQEAPQRYHRLQMASGAAWTWLRRQDLRPYPDLLVAACIASADQTQRRGERFGALLNALAAHRPLDAELVDALVHAVWADRPPTAPGWCVVLASVPTEIAAVTDFPSWAADTLADSASVDGSADVDEDAVRLADLLSHPGLWRSLSPGERDVVEAVTLVGRARRRRLRSGDLRRTARLRARLDEVGGPLPGRLTVAVLDATVLDLSGHHLAELVALHDDRLLARYVDRAHRLLPGQLRRAPADAPRYFRLWTEVLADPTRPYLRRQLGQLLRLLRGCVERMGWLARTRANWKVVRWDRAWRKRWANWAEQVPRRRFGRLWLDGREGGA